MLELLLSIPGEFWVGLSTFVVGILAHRQALLHESKDRLVDRTRRQMGRYELELHDLNDRQDDLRQFTNDALDRLERERIYLTGKIKELMEEIEILKDENNDWRIKFVECQIELKRIKGNECDDTKREV